MFFQHGEDVDIKHNFLTIVTLGSFNPAILTPDFLKDQQIWTSTKDPKGTSSPVVSNLKYGEISFFTELERFQVMHKGVKDFHKSPIIDTSYKYLEVLQYTPLLVQGINFNVNLLQYQDNAGIQAVFQDPIAGITNYAEKTDEYIIDIKTEVTKNKIETLSINCKYYIDDGISVTINLTKLDGEMVLNFNQEVENLRADRNRVKIIYNNYHSILKKFETFLEAIKE